MRVSDLRDILDDNALDPDAEVVVVVACQTDEYSVVSSVWHDARRLRRVELSVGRERQLTAEEYDELADPVVTAWGGDRLDVLETEARRAGSGTVVGLVIGERRQCEPTPIVLVRGW